MVTTAEVFGHKGESSENMTVAEDEVGPLPVFGSEWSEQFGLRKRAVDGKMTRAVTIVGVHPKRMPRPGDAATLQPGVLFVEFSHGDRAAGAIDDVRETYCGVDPENAVGELGRAGVAAAGICPIVATAIANIVRGRVVDSRRSGYGEVHRCGTLVRFDPVLLQEQVVRLRIIAQTERMTATATEVDQAMQVGFFEIRQDISSTGQIAARVATRWRRRKDAASLVIDVNRLVQQPGGSFSQASW